jgi:hypothetical protein
MIFGGTKAYSSKRQQKLVRREVYAAETATPTYPKWSDSSITFDRSDHPELLIRAVNMHFWGY